jgi:hypothetical protein
MDNHSQEFDQVVSLGVPNTETNPEIKPSCVSIIAILDKIPSHLSVVNSIQGLQTHS